MAATDEDRHILLSFSGWGGAGRMFEPLPGNSLEPKRHALASLVPQQVMADARKGVGRSNHTNHEVAEAIWKVVRQLGFTGGRIIDPVAGNGHLIAAIPPDIALNSDITGVEADLLKADLLRQTFMGLGVKTATKLADLHAFGKGHFDLAVAHVPSGGETPEEGSKAGYAKWDAVNYHVAKAVDFLRPDGIAVLIVPASTMDEPVQRHRDWINAHANLVSAIRLPAAAVSRCNCEDHAKDVLILVKRRVPLYPADSQWATIGQAPLSIMSPGQMLEHQVQVGRQRKWVDRPRPINQWYVVNPHQVIGELTLESGVYAKHPWSIAFPEGRKAMTGRIDALIDALPVDLYQSAKVAAKPVRSLLLTEVPACRLVKAGAFVVNDGRICVSRDERVWIDVEDAYTGRARGRVEGLIKLRDCALRLFGSPGDAKDDLTVDSSLDQAYESFVKQFGSVSCAANERLFKSDPDWELLRSLEAYNAATDQYDRSFTHPLAQRVDGTVQ